MKKLNLAGHRFTRLTAVSPVTMKNGKTGWKCVCDCGNLTVVATLNLRNGHTQSCGCISREKSAERMTVHGFSREDGRAHRLHRIWSGMRQRCTNDRHPAFPRYGGRGVTICDEWNSFVAFREWAIANGFAAYKSIDRINNSLGYSPGNCRWADAATQSRNRRNCRMITHDGTTMTLSEWAREIGVVPATLRERLAKWPIEIALQPQLPTRPSGSKPEPTGPKGPKEH